MEFLDALPDTLFALKFDYQARKKIIFVKHPGIDAHWRDYDYISWEHENFFHSIIIILFIWPSFYE